MTIDLLQIKDLSIFKLINWKGFFFQRNYFTTVFVSSYLEGILHPNQYDQLFCLTKLYNF